MGSSERLVLLLLAMSVGMLVSSFATVLLALRAQRAGRSVWPVVAGGVGWLLLVSLAVWLLGARE